jgi:uncharacterized protein (DUF433 family)
MATLTHHIRVDSQGAAWIGDTRYKVLHIVQEALAYGWSPEEIVYQHYGDLSLGQVYAALSFYHDNKGELDAILEKQAEDYGQARTAAQDSAVRRKLRARGLLP